MCGNPFTPRALLDPASMVRDKLKKKAADGDGARDRSRVPWDGDRILKDMQGKLRQRKTAKSPMEVGGRVGSLYGDTGEERGGGGRNARQ